MAPADEAKQTFSTLCVTCHGADGKGDGVAAANLNPKPRNYTDKAWQASVTDDQLAKVILEGGAAVGKSPLMPPNPQLKDKPQVIAELVKIVRGFGQ
jgi:mono/diheme cytochrome c family protein